MGYLFTSESVSEGHPDKVAEKNSDGGDDKTSANEPSSKDACETYGSKGSAGLGREREKERG